MKKALEDFNLEIKEISTKNPWQNADENITILQTDKDIYYDESLKKAWGWENQTLEQKKKYIIKNQFPLPINGNFRKAKYLMLYSNPATEENPILPETKQKLLKCFKLEEKAELIIANKHWDKFYTKELTRFFRYDFEENKNISQKKEKVSQFLNQFCFINYCAYATGINTFNFSDVQIQNMKGKVSLNDLESTKFAIELVKLWIRNKGYENIYIVRARDKVWINHLFAKLELHTMYNENTSDNK